MFGKAISSDTEHSTNMHTVRNEIKLCWDLVPVDFTHIRRGYFAVSGAVLRLPSGPFY